MWDTPATSVGNSAQPSVNPDSAATVAWTDGQLMRLENEWRRAQRSFAYHPVVGITPLQGEPPHEYQVDYRVRTVMMNDAGELQYIDDVSMHLWLPPNFPNQPPIMRPMTNLFHPNIVPEGVYLTRPWHPNDSLVDYVARIGELLSYRSYDPESIVNAVALDWLTENSGMLPLDNRADFSPYAGGEPLGRIHRGGPQTLEDIRRSLEDMRFALLAEEGAPTQAQVNEFARKTRATVGLFLDTDIQENLRTAASECDGWCRELPASAPSWEYLRRQRAATAKTGFAAASLRNAGAALGAALKELDGMVRAEEVQRPSEAAELIPPVAALQPMQMKLPPLVREFEQRAEEVRGLLETLRQPAPEVKIAPDGMLGQRLASQSETVRQSAAAALETANAAMAEVDSLISRAKPELAALELIVAWRDYMDMFTKARAMEKQLAEWGSAGVHAYYLGNTSGSFGPFQFEEAVDLGAARIVVRNPEGSQIEVIDALTQNTLGRGAAGTVTVVLGQGHKKPGHPNTFRLTGRCDDLAIQLDFVYEHTLEAMGLLHKHVSGANSWCGKICMLLADTRQQQKLRDTHRKASHRWKSLMTDLAHLMSFKERLATYHLVSRMGEEVPRIQEMIAKFDVRLKDATEKVQAIMGKGSRNAVTGEMIVPPKLVDTYFEELRIRDRAMHEIARLEGVLKQIAKELAARLAAPRLWGKPEIPPFRALAPLPESIVELQKELTDAAIKKEVAALEELLQVKLPIAGLPAAPAAGAAKSPTPPAAGPAAAPQDVAPKSRGTFADRLFDRLTDRFLDKSSDKSADKPADKPGDQLIEKAADASADKPKAAAAPTPQAPPATPSDKSQAPAARLPLHTPRPAPSDRAKSQAATASPSQPPRPAPSGQSPARPAAVASARPAQEVAPAPSPSKKPLRPVAPPVAVDPLLPRKPAAPPKPTAPLAPPPPRTPEQKKPIVFPTPQPVGEPLAGKGGSVFGAFADAAPASQQPGPAQPVAAPKEKKLASIFGDDDDVDDGKPAS